MFGMIAAIEAQRVALAALQAQQLLMADTGVYLTYVPQHRAHRCAYCRTLDSASVRCPSCGAPR